MRSIILSALAATICLGASAPTISGITFDKTTILPGEEAKVDINYNSNGSPTTIKFHMQAPGQTAPAGKWRPINHHAAGWKSPSSPQGRYTFTATAKNAFGTATSNGSIVVGSEAPPGFIKIPNSEGYTFLGVTPAGGWAVMKWEASYYGSLSQMDSSYKTTNYQSYSTSQPVTSQPNAFPISRAYHGQAENMCANYLRDSDGKTLTGGHLIGIGLWMKIANDITKQPINWSGNAVGSGTLSAGTTQYNAIKSVADNGDSLHTIKNPASRMNSTSVWQLSSGDLIHEFAGSLAEYLYEGQTTYASTGNYDPSSYRNPSNNYFKDLDGRNIPIFPTEGVWGLSQGTGGWNYIVFNSPTASGGNYSTGAGGNFYSNAQSGGSSSYGGIFDLRVGYETYPGWWTYTGNSGYSWGWEMGFRCVVPLN